MATSVRTRLALRGTLTLIAAAGLLIDAYVHFHLAAAYSGVKSSVLSEGDLFRAEATVATITAGALLLLPRRDTAALAFVVAAAGTTAVVLYRYVDVGAFGPFPNMYEPSWFEEKTLSAIAEGIAAVAALLLFALLHAEARAARRAATRPSGGTAAQTRR